MKNFRKVLALVLVVATVFSVVAMASAKTYDDEKDISSTYKQAVDVLTAVEVLNGYEDDTFKPAQSISREEMAKMIAVLANAGDDVSKLYATACTFADVAKDKWSASYVAYCAKTGIVAGRSATTFDPTGKVTGLETAKMLLVTLGFSAEEQGYIGSDWKINVLRDAKNVGLLDNFDAKYDVDAAISRQEAAQMMYNALLTKVVVGVLSENILKVTNAVYKNWNGATLIDANKQGWVKMYGNVIISNTTLFEALYGDKLDVKATGERDCYGRPSTTWTLTIKGKTTRIGTYADTPVWTSHNTTLAEVQEVVKSYDKPTVYVYSDGVQKSGLSSLSYGKGAQIEIYERASKDSKGNTVYNLVVVEINTYIDTIAKINTNKKTFSLSNNANVYYVNEFGLTTADEGAIVLYWPCADSVKTSGKQLHNLKIAEPVTAKITSATTVKGNSAKSTFTAGGTKYEYAAKFDSTMNAGLGVIGETGDSKDYIGAEVDIYLDEFGYVMFYGKVAPAAAKATLLVDKTAFRVKDGVLADGGAQYTYTAKFVEFETSPAVGETVTVDKAMWDVDDSTDHDILVTYTGEADDRAFGQKATAKDGTYAMSNSGKIDGLTNLAANTSTQYLLRVYNYETGKYEYKYFNGKNEVDAAYQLDHLQYFTDGGKFLTYVYAEADYTYTSLYAFILDYDYSEIRLTEGNKKVAYNMYSALVNGEEAYVAYQNVIDENLNFRVWKAELTCIGMNTIDGKPIYVANGAPENRINDGTSFTVKDGTIVWQDPSSKFEAADLADDAKIIVAFPNGWNKMSFVALEDLEDLNDYAERYGWMQGYAWAQYDGNGDIVLMYIDVLDRPGEGIA